MRESVRRVCSPLTASNPSPMAISGTKNDSSATSGSGPPRVKSRRNRNGSSAVISLIVTTPKPCRAEPSRCMAFSFMGLEVAGIDRLEARLLDRQPQQTAAGPDHRPGGVPADVAVRQEAEGDWWAG